MSLSVDSSIKFPFEDLTKVNFVRESDIVKISFKKSTIVQRVGEFYQVSKPDSIRISPSSKLLEEIQALRIEIKYLDGLGREMEIEAKHAKAVFESINQLQTESNFFIYNRLFQEALSSLEQYQYLTSTEINQFRSEIQTSLTLGEYENETEKASDPKKAISLAHYYSTKGHVDNRASLYWLSKAKDFLKEKSLSKFIDIDQFFLRFKKIDSLAILCSKAEEIAEAIARCPSIKEIILDPLELEEDAKSIGSFLTKTTSTKKVTWRAASKYANNGYFQKMSQSLIPLTISALKENKSVEELDFADTKMGDNGVLKLIEAIEGNPQSKIKRINLITSGITAVSFYKLIELIRKTEQITWVNIKFNSGIDAQMIGEIEQIMKERQSTQSL